MVKKVGLLYDCMNNNTGDAAIGLSVQKILGDLGIGFEVLIPGRFNAGDHGTIIVGGGHLLRPGPDAFYDKFRVHGSHILNAVGILDTPGDLQFLEDYRYVTVRSNGDRDKLSYLNKKVRVVPCTTMLLEDRKDLAWKPKSRSIGVHLIPGVFSAKEEKDFIKWASSLPYTIYFIPITHYNYDYMYMRSLSAGIRNSILLPRYPPLEIFTLMGKLDFLISGSLHGAIFSYAHNTPFILWDYDDKMRFFMGDRGLRRYLFKDYKGMTEAFSDLCRELPDYGPGFSRDLTVLHRHVDRLKELLPAPGAPDDGSHEAARLDAVRGRRLKLNSKNGSLYKMLRYRASRIKVNISGRIDGLPWPFK